MATEPLSAALAAAISPRDRMFTDVAEPGSCWRLSPDRRLVFGGRRRLRTTSPEAAREASAAELRRIHPALEGVEITHWWGGVVALTLDRLPHCGHRGGLWYATGCNGTGIAMMTWMGEQVGESVCGSAPLPPFAELSHRSVPLWPLRRLTVPLVGGAVEALDRW